MDKITENLVINIKVMLTLEDQWGFFLAAIRAVLIVAADFVRPADGIRYKNCDCLISFHFILMKLTTYV